MAKKSQVACWAGPASMDKVNEYVADTALNPVPKDTAVTFQALTAVRIICWLTYNTSLVSILKSSMLVIVNDRCIPSINDSNVFPPATKVRIT